MATKLDQTFKIDAPPRAVMDMMRNPAFIEESEKARDAITVKVTSKQEDDARHVFEIFTTTYARGVGGIDKSKTEENRTTVTWDKAKTSAKWDWKGAHAMVKVTGTHTLTEKGGGTELRMTMECEIGIPLVGKMIEKKVKEGFEQGWPDYASRLRKKLTNP